MKDITIKVTKQRTSLILVLILPILMACATPAANEIKLNMDWKEGQTTKHVVSYQLGLQMQFGDDKEKIQNLDNSTTYEGTYTQKISKHEKGLLVSFSDIEVKSANPSFAVTPVIPDFKPSPMQFALAKVTALLLVARPDYIMSPTGEFIALHDYDQFATDQRARVIELVLGDSASEIPKNGLGPMFDFFIGAASNKAAFTQQIQQDLALLKDIDKLTLQLGKSVKTKITPAYTSKHTRNNKKGVKVDGMLSYNGNAKCKWKTNTPCIDIRFSMDDEKTYDVKMIIEPDTLTLHSYEAITDLTIDEGNRDSVTKANVSSSFVHSVKLK